MERIRQYAVNGFNEQVQQIKEDAKEPGHKILVSLITFNGKVYEHFWNVDADQLKELTLEEFECVGATSLHDAQGYAIEKLLDTTDPNHEDNAYLLILITDGENTKNTFYSLQGLKELCAFVQGKDNWTITYMGCDGGYLRNYARETGVSMGNCAVWKSDAEGTDVAFKESRSKLQSYNRNRRTYNTKSVLAFHGANAAEMADYTKVEGYVDPVANNGFGAVSPNASRAAVKLGDVLSGRDDDYRKAMEAQQQFLGRRTCGTPPPPPEPKPGPIKGRPVDMNYKYPLEWVQNANVNDGGNCGGMSAPSPPIKALDNPDLIMQNANKTLNALQSANLVDWGKYNSNRVSHNVRDNK